MPEPARLQMPGKRQALLYQVQDGPQPTLIVLHPYSGDALSTAKYSGFLQAAIPRGFNVVVPEALAHEWHDSPDETPAHERDIAFLISLTEKLIGDGIADPSRVFVAGISNGGMMAFAIVCARPDLFAGIGTISAGMPKHLFDSCVVPKPMPLVMINGDADDVLPFRGGDVGDRRGFFRRIAGIEATAALFAMTNGDDPVSEPRRTRMRDGKRRIERVDWDDAPDATVTVVRVIGGGHDVIGWRTPVQAALGRPPRGPATADAIMQKFVELGSDLH